jgi:hypothetical protein
MNILKHSRQLLREFSKKHLYAKQNVNKSEMDRSTFYTTNVYDLSKLTGMSLILCSRVTIYCSIIFANRTESTELVKISFFKYIKCENILTATEARFLSNAPTQTRPPDSRLPPNTDSAKPHHWYHHRLNCISCYQSRHRQNLISIFSHGTNGALVQ